MRALAFDTETRGLDWFNPDQRAFLVTWAWSATDVHHEEIVDGKGREFLLALAGLRGGDRLWGHNLKFDLHHVREQLGFDMLAWAEWAGVELWDSDSLDRVLHPEGQRKDRGGHGLKELSTLYIDPRAKDAEDDILEMAKALGLVGPTAKSMRSAPIGAYYEIYRAYPDKMIRYARDDAEFTWRLGEEHLLPQLAKAEPGIQRVAQLEREVLPVLVRAEQRGVATDQDQVRAFKQQFEAERRRLETAVALELGDAALGGQGSEAALEEALLKIGVPLTEKVPSGDRFSTDKRVLAPFTEDFPVVADLLELRRVERFLNTYIDPMVGRDVIHTDFQQQEAWTGRMSARRPNMQNWPRRAGQEVRNVLRARPGHKLLIADYSQMEAMIVVRYLNDAGLIEAINGGLDMNAWMAAQIWGGDIADWDKTGPKAEGEQSRATARHTLYATMYGAGARKVNEQLPFLDRGPYYGPDHPAILNAKPWKGTTWPQVGWQHAEARALIKAVKDSLPGWYNFNKRLQQKIQRVGYVNTILGRKNPVSPDKMYVAVAAIVQGTGADLLKLAAVRARRMLEPYGAELIMFTHDELVAEAPEDQAEAALAALVEAMEGAYPEHNPRLRASGALADHYGEGH